MTRIRTLLVDDEALARRGLRQLLDAYEDVDVVGECANGRDALSAIATLAPTLVFLDIQMPELGGMDLMRSLIAERGAANIPATVFLTAYEEFALDAFDVDAVDYLVKPVSDERFASAMHRVRRHIARRDGASQSVKPEHLLIPTAKGRRVVAFDEIDWIGADDYYAAVHTGGRRYLLRETMTSLESRLDPSTFLRVHRAAIVNVARLRELVVVDGETFVILRDGTRLPVSRRRRLALVKAMS
jgi:two-component system LytT family response regulator